MSLQFRGQCTIGLCLGAEAESRVVSAAWSWWQGKHLCQCGPAPAQVLVPLGCPTLAGGAARKEGSVVVIRLPEMLPGVLLSRHCKNYCPALK